MILLSLLTGFASELHLVRSGETVEAIADDDPTRAGLIRSLNSLAPGTQPTVGTMLKLPPPKGFHNDQEAFLINLNGEGSFTSVNGDTTAATPWTPIPAGTTVCTDEKSIATLRLASTCDDDGSASDNIVFNPGTCLVVESSFSSTAGRNTVVRVTQGAVMVAPTADTTGEVTVITPSGITTGSGGGYRVTIEPDAARTEALVAPVAVSGSGAEVTVGKGQGSRVKTGEVPSEPIDLLLPVQPILPDDRSMLRRLEFTWEPSPDGFAYRFELSTTPRFTNVLYIEDVSDAAYRPGLLLFPVHNIDHLHWRVSVFDRLGFLGMPSTPRSFTLPPELLP